MEKIIISCLESRVETNRSMYARFLLGPFKDDQAVTIGTALRRSLLSKVKSLAITAIHIQGVTHEFSTIVGVRESVLDLALNFQQIVLRRQSSKKQTFSNRHKERSQTFVAKTNLCKSGAFATLPKPKVLDNRSFYTVSKDVSKRLTNSKNGTVLENRVAINKSKLAPLSTPRLLQAYPFGAKQSQPFRTASLNRAGFDSEPVKALNDAVQIGYLQVQGPAVIYANDLKLPVGVECVDPTQYIATLSTEGLLVVKFVISEKSESFEKSKEKAIADLRPDIQNGYQNIAPIKLLSKQGLGNALFQGSLGDFDTSRKIANAGSLRSFDSTLGLRNTIFLDPTFDSVFQVNYIIEKDDLFNQPRERIILELWTNGSIHPRQALHKASLSLISTFSVFRNVFHLDSL